MKKVITIAVILTVVLALSLLAYRAYAVIGSVLT